MDPREQPEERWSRMDDDAIPVHPEEIGVARIRYGAGLPDQQDLPSTLVTLILVEPLVLGSRKVTVTGQGEPDPTVTVISSEDAPGETVPDGGMMEATLGSLLASQLKSSVDDTSLVITTLQTVGSPVADSHRCLFSSL